MGNMQYAILFKQRPQALSFMIIFHFMILYFLSLVAVQGRRKGKHLI